MNIAACQTAWPNAQNCVEIDFSIRLKLLPQTDSNQTNIASAQKTMTNSTEYYNLSRNKLFSMWIKFGRSDFIDNGFKVVFIG